MWKYMMVLEKLVTSHSWAIQSIVDPTTVKNCRKTDHLNKQTECVISVLLTALLMYEAAMKLTTEG